MNSFYKKFKSYIKESKDFLKYKDSLYNIFWKDKVLNRNIARKLVLISQDVMSSIKLDIVVEDLILTGSIASYGWHSKSDVDLHILIDFSKVDENYTVVKEMFDAIRIAWNIKHDIEIFGHEVEIYFQDISEPHESAGIYSILDGDWLVEPIPEKVNFDLKNIEKKASTLEKAIKHAQKLMYAKRFEEAHNYSSKLMKKIKRMRQAGLEKEGGIYSVENMAFKMLRNSGFLEKLAFCRDISYDKSMSMRLTENVFNTNPPKQENANTQIKQYFEKIKLSEYLEYDDHPYSDIETLLDPEMPAPWDKK